VLRTNPDSISRKLNLRHIAIFAMLAGILSTPTLSQAVEYTAARKAGRDLAAMTTGFLEVPGNMVAASREHGPAMGVPLGFALGLGKLVVRELVGVYEFVSCPFEAPAGFQPIIDPEFPWDYFEESSASAPAKRSD
jgi:putative exosortase-associated protein (TIGR04073 family)